MIHLKDPGVQACECFEELTQYCYPEDKVIASNCAKYFINKTQGDSLMIIFDGYDEVSRKMMIFSFIRELLTKSSSRSILPNSSIVITSRPHSISDLYQLCDCRVEIMGFTEDDRDNHLKNTFKLSLKKYRCAKEYLENHLVINSACYTPLNMKNFIDLVRYEERLPETQTELIMESINLTINKHRDKKKEKRIVSLQDPSIKDEMFCLAKFAYRMIEKGHLVFTEEEINKAKIKMDEDYNMFGLLQSVQFYERVNKPQKRLYSFTHFSIQEYLAAYYLSKSCYITQYCAIYNKFWKAEYFGIWRMYTGITGGETIPLKMFLSGERIMYAGIRYICGNKFPGISEECKKNKVMCLQLYLIFLEAPKSQIAEKLSSIFDKKIIDLHGENLKLQDMEILGSFIARSFISKTWGYVNVSDCSINDKDFMVFYEQLTLKDGRTKPLIAKLNLSGNKICELSTVFSLAAEYKIIRLLVSENSFENCRNFESHLHGDYTTLKFLDLSSNNLQNQHLEYICEALSNHNNLKELIINDNKISDQGIKPLIKLRIQLELLQTIRYEDNSFSDYQYIDELLKFIIKYLNFRKTLVSFRENNQVCYFIIILGCIKDISAKQCNFVANTEKVSFLSLTVGNDQPLKPCMYEKYSSLADAFHFMKRMKSLTELNLSGIKIDNSAGEVLSDILASHLQRLEILLLNNCGITSEIAIKLGEAIQVCSAIKELQLCQNQIDDEAMIVFVKPLFDLKLIIKLENNKFSHQSKFLLNIVKNDVQNDTIDFSNNYYIVKSFLDLLDHTSNGFSTTTMKFVSNVVQTKDLLLGVVNEQYTLKKQLEMTVNASKLFQKFSNLSQLNLSGVIITEKTVVNLFSASNSVLTVQYVIMNNCKLNSEIVINLVSQLQNAKLKEFQLSNNMIDNKATKTLIHAIFKWNFLKVFKVDDNNFSSGDARLFEMLGKLLKLPGNVFRMNMHPPLISYMEEVPTTDSTLLTKIFEINNLQLNDSHANPCSDSMLPLLSNKNCLYIEHDFFIFACTFFFQRFVNLKDLCITKVFISKEVGDDFCKALCSNLQCSLYHLCISYCTFTASFCFNLLNQMKETSVAKFELCCNNIDIPNIEDHLFETFITKTTQVSGEEISRGCNMNLHMHNQIIIICMLLLEISVKDKMIVEFIDNVHKIIEVFNNDGVRCIEVTSNFDGIKAIHIMELAKLTFDVSNILHVDLSGICIDEHIAGSLAFACGNSLKFLQVLKMNNCSLSTKIISDILRKLHIATNMKEFQLCNNSITDKATKLLILNVFTWKCLKILKLDNNKFTYNPNELFAFVLKSSRYGDSSGDSIFCDLNTTSLDSLITLIKYMRTFSTDRSLVECTSLFHKQLNSITTLNFSGIFTDEQRIDEMVNIFGNILQHLKVLIMNNCGLSSRTVTILLSNLHVATGMKKLQLCKNCINEEAIKSIITAIFVWSSLEALSIESNRFKIHNPNEYFKFVIKALNSPHIYLDSICNNLNGKEIKYFITLLKHVKSMSTDNSSKQFATSFYKQLSCIKLVKLNLSGATIDKQSANLVFKAFDTSLQYLQQLNMNNCSLSSKTLVTILSKLHNAVNMKELQICNNYIDDEAVSCIIIAMFQWNSFKTLEYRYNNFKENSLKILSFTLQLFNISIISEDSTITDSESVKLLFSQLSYNNCKSRSTSSLFQRLTGLTILDLSCIQLTSQDKSTITIALADNLNSLQVLNLDSCNLGSLPTINVIKAINKTTLKELSISNNKITDNVAYAIKDFVNDNNVLTEIYLSHNDLGTVGILTITDGLVNCQNIQILDVSYNNITDKCTESLCYLMKRLYQYGKLSSVNVHDDNLSRENLNNIYYAAGWAIWLKFLNST